ncbi:MAG TPA: hypothetical protein VJ729_14040 [Nitrososphaeraceae archaeon]|nr:hypothetical protein [Nitrososphaeraceae archaeon]
MPNELSITHIIDKINIHYNAFAATTTTTTTTTTSIQTNTLGLVKQVWIVQVTSKL